jgi:hypothetical protein
MWERLVRAWKSLLNGTVQSSDQAQPTQLIPPELIANLDKLVNDELRIRERKRIADRFQRAGAIAIALVVFFFAILGPISADLMPTQTGTPTNSDSLLLVYITVAVVVWNALGWWGAREKVRFTSLYLFLGVAAFLCVVAVYEGFGLVLAWSTGHPVVATWAKDAGWGALASSLLPLLGALGIAIGTGFAADRYYEATSRKGMSWRSRSSWYVYVFCGLLGLISSVFVMGNLTSGSLPSPELTTFAFVLPYVSSWLSVMAWVPLAVVAHRRWTSPPKTG